VEGIITELGKQDEKERGAGPPNERARRTDRKAKGRGHTVYEVAKSRRCNGQAKIAGRVGGGGLRSGQKKAKNSPVCDKEGHGGVS